MDEEVHFGIRNRWGEDEPFGLSPADRRHHVYVVGKSGTGKTTLLRNLIVQDIESGRGVSVIDPHGDLATELLDYIPRRRIEDVLYFNPCDPDYAVAFNLLANVPPHRRHVVASGIVGSFKAIYPEFFGPRMEYVFHAAVLALLDCKNVSFLGIQRMLSDARYRAWVVKQIRDPVVRSFWDREFESHDKRTQAEIVSPILNKIGPILMTPDLRNILGQVKNRINPRFMMDHGRIFIANLSKGTLGADKANLLGSLIVAQFQTAAMSRAEIEEHERRDFMLYVDEFQSFVSDSFAAILSEARKYRLCLTLSHQYLGQLKPGILDAVIGNVGSLLSFRLGHSDAEELEKAFGKAYPPSHFTSLNNHEVCARLLCEGKEVEPFVGHTLPRAGTRHGRRDTIIFRSRQKYATPRSKVERRIEAWFGLRAE